MKVLQRQKLHLVPQKIPPIPLTCKWRRWLIACSVKWMDMFGKPQLSAFQDQKVKVRWTHSTRQAWSRIGQRQTTLQMTASLLLVYVCKRFLVLFVELLGNWFDSSWLTWESAFILFMSNDVNYFVASAYGRWRFWIFSKRPKNSEETDMKVTVIHCQPPIEATSTDSGETDTRETFVGIVLCTSGIIHLPCNHTIIGGVIALGVFE